MTTTFGGSYSLDDLRTHAAHTADAADVSILGDEEKASAFIAAGAALGDLIKEIERLKRFEPEPVSLSSSEELENLFTDFSSALLMRARAAQEMDGFTDDWKNDDWRDQLNLQIAHHIAYGDPRDSALYCAFAWYHGWEIQLPGIDALSPLLSPLRTPYRPRWPNCPPWTPLHPTKHSNGRFWPGHQQERPDCRAFASPTHPSALNAIPTTLWIWTTSNAVCCSSTLYLSSARGSKA